MNIAYLLWYRWIPWIPWPWK